MTKGKLVANTVVKGTMPEWNLIHIFRNVSLLMCRKGNNLWLTKRKIRYKKFFFVYRGFKGSKSRNTNFVNKVISA